jgi:hypothetical protein
MGAFFVANIIFDCIYALLYNPGGGKRRRSSLQKQVEVAPGIGRAYGKCRLRQGQQDLPGRGPGGQ